MESCGGGGCCSRAVKEVTKQEEEERVPGYTQGSVGRVREGQREVGRWWPASHGGHGYWGPGLVGCADGSGLRRELPTTASGPDISHGPVGLVPGDTVRGAGPLHESGAKTQLRPRWCLP